MLGRRRTIQIDELFFYVFLLAVLLLHRFELLHWGWVAVTAVVGVAAIAYSYLDFWKLEKAWIARRGY